MADTVRMVLPSGIVIEASRDDAIYIANQYRDASTTPNALQSTGIIGAKKIAPRRVIETQSRNKLLTYIKSQPDYTHSIGTVSQHFIGRVLSYPDGTDAANWLNGTRNKLKRIRTKIAKEEDGHWIEGFDGNKFKVFIFEKNKVEVNQG